ncbi:amidohydrolase family protein [Nakamurella aerolata]|uniref:Amidohydrolase family protein n=1 Tax=Nakamurella aerolata TaxID=1656892 RepID=A0A849A668_9ACTN|nr:amidohydrolase family protein [Nakamurella aerolata]NNG34598.1 amidohydrolase family protein [Nakamurella aerolata]
MQFQVTGTDAATGERYQRWVADGVFVPERPAAGEVQEVAGWVLPGLVDAHCHIGYSADGVVDLATAERQARVDLATGVTVIRDCGSPLDTRPLVGRDDLPVLLRAGWHIARPKRYIRYLGIDLDDPAELPAEVARQLQYGDGWIKLVGDWIDRSIGDLAPLWPEDVLAEAISVAHQGGARVTAHVFSEDALPPLLAAGIDCIEHGTGLTADTIDQMVARGVHLVPTLINIRNFPTFADAADRYPAYAKHMRDLHERHLETFAAAAEAGIPLHSGTDAGGFVEHGRIADELTALLGLGLDPRRTLHNATTAARAWLGAPPGDVGDPADLVVYDADPAEHPEVLQRPTVVLRAGRPVGGRMAGSRG